MKSFLLTLCAVAISLCASAQTIVDLNQKRVGSASVRPSINPDPFSKSRIQARDLAEERRDSAEFNDLLTEAFNFLHKDSLSQGQRLLEQALALRPKGKAAPVIRLNLGQICFARQQYGDAIRLYTDALRDRPDYHEARQNRASAYFYAQQYAAALSDIDQLLTLDPPLPLEERKELTLEKWMAHRHLRQPEAALAAAEQWLRAAPNDSHARLLVAQSLRELRRYDEARQRLDHLLDAEPDNLTARCVRAEILEELGLLDLAREDYDHILQRTPNDREVRLARGQLLLQLGLPRAARQDLDAARALGVDQSLLQPLYDQLR